MPNTARSHVSPSPRSKLAAGAACFVLLLCFTSTPSETSIPGPSELEATTPEELEALVELSDWLPPPSGFHALSEADITAAIRERPQGFELFRHLNADQDELRFLRGLPYGRLIQRTASRHGVDPLLVAAVVEAESRFEWLAVSEAGALGLMQVMPATAAGFGVAEPLDPHVNVEVGTRYLRRLLDAYDGDLELALAAYNAGPAAVDHFGGVPPYQQTRGFVARVLSTYVGHHMAVWDASGGADWPIGP